MSYEDKDDKAGLDNPESQAVLEMRAAFRKDCELFYLDMAEQFKEFSSLTSVPSGQSVSDDNFPSFPAPEHRDS